MPVVLTLDLAAFTYRYDYLFVTLCCIHYTAVY